MYHRTPKGDESEPWPGQLLPTCPFSLCEWSWQRSGVGISIFKCSKPSGSHGWTPLLAGCRTEGGAAQHLGETGEQVPGAGGPLSLMDLSPGRGARYPGRTPCLVAGTAPWIRSFLMTTSFLCSRSINKQASGKRILTPQPSF